jgi:3-dehydrotetronate 4-kinase
MALLGIIADDFTGATDIAGMLVKGGMRTVQTIGVPAPDMALDDVDGIVVALKSRTIAPDDAIAQSLGALSALQARGCRQFFFKYCSTFDSTDRGNIGPVADALLDRLNAPFTIFCPAFPANGRAIFLGYLFVGSVLLSESSMRDHPLTPMTDASLVRVLQRQTKHKVGLIALRTVQSGANAMRKEIEVLKASGVRHAVVDAGTDPDLMTIGEAVADLALVTGGSGVAMGLPANFRKAGLLRAGAADRLPKADGKAAIIAGSCSAATLDQIATYRSGGGAALELDTAAICDGKDVAKQALDWAGKQSGPALLYASAPPERVKAVQARFGVEESSKRIEGTMAMIAEGLVSDGVRRLVVAGGETSGAVVQALGARALRIGPEIDPGVPWTATTTGSGASIALALKSGNFGAADFFTKAFAKLP